MTFDRSCSKMNARKYEIIEVVGTSIWDSENLEKYSKSRTNPCFWNIDDRAPGKSISKILEVKRAQNLVFQKCSEPQDEGPTAHHGKNTESSTTPPCERKKRCQKNDHFSKWRLQNDDSLETQSIFEGENLAASLAWLGLAWLAWLAGWLAR